MSKKEIMFESSSQKETSEKVDRLIEKYKFLNPRDWVNSGGIGDVFLSIRVKKITGRLSIFIDRHGAIFYSSRVEGLKVILESITLEKLEKNIKLITFHKFI